MKGVQLALVGFGWFAELLVTRVLADVPQVQVVAVVDPSIERRQAASALGLIAVGRLDELPSNCEAVAILTPHNTHRALVEQAAGAGLHVLCEKAFAVTSQDCRAMITACAQAGVVLAVGHMQKLFPAYSRAIELVRSGRYGSPVALQVSGFHWCPVFPGWWRTKQACGGLLYWTGIHDLDTMRALAGSDASTVYAAAGRHTDDYTEYEDMVAVTIVYDNGVIGTLQVAEHDPLRTFEESFELSVLLERGSIHLSPVTGTLQHAGRDGMGRSPVIVEVCGTFAEMEESAYRRELMGFAETIKRGQPDWSSATDGLRCVETLETAYRSVRTGSVEPVEKASLDSLLSSHKPETA